MSSVSSEDADDEGEDNDIGRNSYETREYFNTKNTQFENLSEWAKQFTSTPKITLDNRNYIKKRFVINDIGSEEVNGYESGFDPNENVIKSSSSSLEDGRNHLLEFNKESENCFPQETFNHTHVQFLLDENQKLKNQVMLLDQRLSASKGDCDGLAFKFRELEKINSLKDGEIARLEGRIKMLEMQVQVEKEAKEEYQRKLKVADSNINSLQYQLMEVGRSDCLVRARETHDAVVENLKQKHENEVVVLKGEIEGLRRELESKKCEILNLNNQISKINKENQDRNFGEQFKEMVEMTKNLWEKEMKEKMENEMKLLIQNTRAQSTKNSQEEIQQLEKQWELELQKQVEEVIRRLQYKAKLTSESETSFISLTLIPVIDLWDYLEKRCEEKESILLCKLHEFRQAKCQLDEALAQSKMNTSNKNVNETLLNELKIELEKVKLESDEMKHKFQKYKHHYHQLVKKHKIQIEKLQTEFAIIIQEKLTKI